MQHINSNWRELQKYGIFMLTGESCAYSMRVLCDVNEKGWRILRNYLGMDASSSKLWKAVDKVSAQLDNFAEISGEDKPTLAKHHLRHQAENVCILPEPWNSQGNPLGSIMLSRNCFPDLAAFILLNETSCQWVFIMKDGTLCGAESREEADQVRSILGDSIKWTFTCPDPDNIRGDRYVHAMSGRSL
jgi:hypothetical protein